MKAGIWTRRTARINGSPALNAKKGRDSFFLRSADGNRLTSCVSWLHETMRNGSANSPENLGGCKKWEMRSGCDYCEMQFDLIRFAPHSKHKQGINQKKISRVPFGTAIRRGERRQITNSVRFTLGILLADHSDSNPHADLGTVLYYLPATTARVGQKKSKH
jgi:hypothetical protein